MGWTGDEFAEVFESQYGPIDYEYGIRSGSTDFVSQPPPLSLSHSKTLHIYLRIFGNMGI